MKNLKPGEKWGKQETQGYMDNAFSNWIENIEDMAQELNKIRNKMLEQIKAEKSQGKEKFLT
jgi:aspartate/tyrosine/aromatic aminotransferase